MKDKKQTAQIKAQYMRASIAPDSINEEKRTADLVWSVGSKVLRSPWFGEPFYEELSMDKEHIRMGRLNNGAPLLDTHNSWDLKGVIGVVRKAWIADGKGHATVQFSKRKDVEPIWEDVKEGIVRNVSVGYRIHKFEKIKSEDEIKTYRATDWEPMEISAVPVGADAGAGFRTSEKDEEFTCELITRAESALEENDMKDKEKKDDAALGTETRTAEEIELATKQATEQGSATERTRVLEIGKLCRTHKMDEKFQEKLVAEGVSLEAARSQVLDQLVVRDSQTTTKNHVRVEAGELDEIKTRREGITEALLHRHDAKAFALTEKGQDFRGMSLLRIAEEIVGIKRARGMSKLELATRALSTSDFPEILANTAGKTLRRGYDDEPRTFVPWCVQGTLPDYKEVSRTALGEGPNLAKILEGGEFTVGTVGEGAEKYSLADYGKILAITHKTIINDDLGAFTRIPKMFGAAAGRVESDIVYAFLTGSHEMSDEEELFDASAHGNKASSGTTIPNGINAAKAAMRKQKGLDNKAFLNLMAAFLIVGPDKETEGKQVLSSLVVPSESSKVNVHANSMDLIVEARITGNLWLLAASPSRIDTIEFSYLEGMNGPEITTKEGFEVDGVMIKCKHVFGAKPIDFRGMYYNAGA